METRNDLSTLERLVKSGNAEPSPTSIQQPPYAGLDRQAEAQAIRGTIENGLRGSIRAALQSDLQQGLKDERQLTESSLMIRYDAMVCRLVKDHVSKAVSELRVIIEDAVTVVGVHSAEAAQSSKDASTSASNAEHTLNEFNLRNVAIATNAASATDAANATNATSMTNAPNASQPSDTMPKLEAGVGAKKRVTHRAGYSKRAANAGPSVEISDKVMSLENLCEDFVTPSTDI